MLWLVATAVFMQMLDTTIVNTALPSMAASLGEPPLRMQAVVISYALTVAMLIPASGWLSDRFGTRRVFIAAIAIFTIGSLACGVSPGLRELAASRVLQGVGGAMLLPVGRLTILRVVPRPGDINANGHIFGGWVLSQMDVAAGIVAAREAQGPVATVAIAAMEFLAPILLQDLISVYAQVERIGRTSIAIRIRVVASRDRVTREVDVTSGLFTFVALDENHRPRPVKRG